MTETVRLNVGDKIAWNNSDIFFVIISITNNLCNIKWDTGTDGFLSVEYITNLVTSSNEDISLVSLVVDTNTIVSKYRY